MHVHVSWNKTRGKWSARSPATGRVIFYASNLMMEDCQIATQRKRGVIKGDCIAVDDIPAFDPDVYRQITEDKDGRFVDAQQQPVTSAANAILISTGAVYVNGAGEDRSPAQHPARTIRALIARAAKLANASITINHIVIDNKNGLIDVVITASATTRNISQGFDRITTSAIIELELDWLKHEAFIVQMIAIQLVNFVHGNLTAWVN